jgi:hypothetical protein
VHSQWQFSAVHCQWKFSAVHSQWQFSAVHITYIKPYGNRHLVIGT